LLEFYVLCIVAGWRR